MVMVTRYSPGARSASVSGVLPLGRPFTVTAAPRGIDSTTSSPFARGGGGNATGAAGAVLGGWRVSAIATYRSGYPLTVFVQNNRSRSQWQPSLGPGIGRDRPSYAPGFDAASAVTGNPAQWFNPQAFVLQPAGTFGNTGRGDFEGPDLRVVDLSFTKDVRPATGTALELRVEIFNVFNRANFGVPNLVAFAGAADNEAPLGNFGRIRNTVTSARQVQLGVRLRF